MIVNASLRNRALRSPAEIPRGVGYFVREASRAYARNLQTLLTEHDVTLPQFFYLRVLWSGDGISQVALRRQIGADRGTASFVLTTMQRAGMIERRGDPSDLRKTRIFLTPFGRRLKTPLLRLANRVNAAATRGMTERDVARVKASLQRMIANLAEVS